MSEKGDVSLIWELKHDWNFDIGLHLAMEKSVTTSLNPYQL